MSLKWLCCLCSLLLSLSVAAQDTITVYGEQTIDEVEVRGIQTQTTMLERGTVDAVNTMPDATGGSIESLLITFAGVSQTNELSTQYNVRGGSFDENAVYVNGIEVRRPLLVRSGQQEGLSFVNPNMVESVDFSAGGFGVQYGDKMSSVLAIQYKRPTTIEASLSLSILGANAYIGWGDSVRSQMHGIRYKTSKYMLGALPTKGNYQPTFVDYQTQMTWQIGKKSQATTERPWRLTFLGNFSFNHYTFQPDSMSEGFGGMYNAMTKTIWYEGQEKDRFLTAFAALGFGYNKGAWSHSIYASGFYTNEQEHYDIYGEYVLSEQGGSMLATGKSLEHARNSLQEGVATVGYSGAWKKDANTLSWGATASLEVISDKISEWEWRDSAGYSMPNAASSLELFYTQKGTNTMTSGRLEAYMQDSYRWTTDKASIFLAGGVRLNYWSFNNEVLVSPRAQLTILPAWRQSVAFRIGAGLYYQAPFYKEVRDTLITDGVTRVQLNRNLKAQRSTQLVFGSDYYFRIAGRPFKFTAEAYGKYMDRMESYTVENVRVRYSGQNDAKGYTVGLDLKLFGELVPGVDSWLSFSTMRSRMHLLDDKYNQGWFPTPNEQRWSVSLYFQDYIPKLPQFRFHLKMLFAEGQPFGYPHSEAHRYLAHLPVYKRIDLGLSYTFSADKHAFMRKPSAQHIKDWGLYFEIFNIVGWKNVNSYYWISAANGTSWASPNYLTGRMFNVRIFVDIK